MAKSTVQAIFNNSLLVKPMLVSAVSKPAAIHVVQGTLEYSTEAPAAKTLAVLRDPSNAKRGAQYLSWHPDGSRKVWHDMQLGLNVSLRQLELSAYLLLIATCTQGKSQIC